MVRDNRRIAAPDNCISPNVFREKEKVDKIVDDKEVRKDGRAEDDLKLMSLEVGIVPSVTGSAYLECGKTKIICSVIGPRDVLNRSDSATKGQLFCEFKYGMYSCKERQPYMPSDEELAISKAIQDSLKPVILLHKFPKSRLDIAIFVLENDGGAVSAAFTCAGAALSNAGVEMYDLPIGCSLVHCDSKFLLDPTAEEESYTNVEDFTKVSMAMMVEYKSQVIFMDSLGSVNPSLLTQSMKKLQPACHQILTDIRECLKCYVQNMNAEQMDEPSEGSLGKKMVTQLKLLQPQKYIRTYLENNVRTDGRNLSEFRPVIINIGSIETANGSALVKLGGSSVLCGIKAELTNPIETQADKGFFVPNVTLTSICSNRFAPGPPTEEAQVYSQIIMDLWKNAPFLDPSSLCVSQNNLVWCLFADMTCLSYDGSILDTCILALMAALKNTKLPEVLVNMDTNKIVVTDNLSELKLDYFVFSSTYAIVNDSAVADPSSEEESLSRSLVTVFLNKNVDICVHSFGSIIGDQLLSCIESSKQRYFEMKELIENLN